MLHSLSNTGERAWERSWELRRRAHDRKCETERLPQKNTGRCNAVRARTTALLSLSRRSFRDASRVQSIVGMSALALGNEGHSKRNTADLVDRAQLRRNRCGARCRRQHPLL